MAQEIINIGAAANDGSGDPLRTAFDKANLNFDELYAEDAVIQGEISDLDYRKDMAAVSTGIVGEVFLYSTPFAVLRPVIYDYEGLGIEVTAFDADGFTITSLAAGNFGYETKNDR